MPKVILVCPFYNRGKLVERTVRSITGQTYGDYVAHFVDDGSKDDTLERLSAYESERIQVKSQSNRGFTATLIETIAATDSDYICIQGSGDVSLPQRLEKQARLLDENTKIVAAGCQREIIMEATGKRRVERPTVKDDVFAQLIRMNPFSHGEMMFRRADYEAVGGYRSQFTFRQDLDLWLRLCARGRFGVVPQVLYRGYSLNDSVSGNPVKLAKAIAARELALYSAFERRAGREDPIDRDGAEVMARRPKSARLANELAFAANRRVARGAVEDAKILAKAAQDEMLTPYVRLTTALTKLPLITTFYSAGRQAKSLWRQAVSR